MLKSSKAFSQFSRNQFLENYFVKKAERKNDKIDYHNNEWIFFWETEVSLLTYSHNQIKMGAQASLFCNIIRLPCFFNRDMILYWWQIKFSLLFIHPYYFLGTAMLRLRYCWACSKWSSDFQFSDEWLLWRRDQKCSSNGHL